MHKIIFSHTSRKRAGGICVGNCGGKMACPRRVEVVQGCCNTTQMAVFPTPDEMFTDPIKKHIVSFSLEAHALFVKAIGMNSSDRDRPILLKLAIQMRVDEKKRWLALTPPDVQGAWKADLAMASYQWETRDMVAAFDTLMKIRSQSPAGCTVREMALHNLEAMYKQVRQQLPQHEQQCGTVSVEVLGLVRQFWTWVATLPEGDEK